MDTLSQPEPPMDTAATLASIRNHMLGVVFTLLGIGLVLVYSASAVRASRAGWELHFMANQARWLIIGLAGLALMSRLDYRWLRRLWPLLLFACLGLLVAVRIPGIGTNVRGAYRWFRFGGFSVQASEIAKLGLVIVLAALLARTSRRGFTFWRHFLPAALLIGLTAGLVALEPDFGTAALITAVLMAMLITAGARWWHIGMLVLAGAPPALYVGLTRFDHIRARILAWLNGATTGAGWQPFMSQVALGSGGTLGMGLGEGYAKLYYLPDAHTDFIFAIAGQELGLVGTISILVLFAILVHEGIRLVQHAPDRFAQLLAFGIILLIGLQAAFNIAVVTATIPPKGISLPFVSFGGSGLCVSLAAVGLLVSITRQPAPASEAVAETDRPATWRERVTHGDVADLPAVQMEDAA